MNGKARGMLIVCLGCMLAGCAGSTLPPEQTEDAVAGLDGFGGLEADARTIVRQVVGANDLDALCGEGVDSVKQSVRQAVINVMFSEGLSDPRQSGTAAGHFIAARCREINPDY